MAKNTTRLRVEAQDKILAAITELAATVQRTGSMALAEEIVTQANSVARRWGAREVALRGEPAGAAS